MAETITANGIELQERFLIQLGRLAWQWHKQKSTPRGQDDQGRARGMNGSVTDARRNG